MTRKGSSKRGGAGDRRPVIVLRDALYNGLRGGYRDTIAQLEGLGDDMKAEAYLDRLIFNMNPLTHQIPEDAWGGAARDKPRFRRAFLCAADGLMGDSFLGGRTLDEIASTETAYREALKRFHNHPLRLTEKSSPALVESFKAGWPPRDYETESFRRLTDLSNMYSGTGMFNEKALEKFLSREEAHVEKIGKIGPGKTGFRDTAMLFAEEGAFSLCSLNIFRVGGGNENTAPAIELIERLVQSFESIGERKEDIEHFRVYARRSLDRYLDYLDKVVSPARRTAPSRGLFLDKYKHKMPADERLDRLQIAWIYNIVVPAFYGPAEANDNCFGDIAPRKTMVANVRYSPRPVEPSGNLSHGMGDAVIRRLCSDGSHRDIVHLDLDKIPEHGRELFRLFGRDYDEDEINNVCNSLDTYDEHLRMARELVPGTPRGRFADLAQTDPSEVNADVRKLTVSRAHFAIFFADGEAVLVDTKSMTGTKVMRMDGTVFLVTPDSQAEPPEGVDEVVTGLALKRLDYILLGAQDFVQLEVV